MRRLTTDVLASDRNLAHGAAAVGAINNKYKPREMAPED
jgi:hypothetical protein